MTACTRPVFAPVAQDYTPTSIDTGAGLDLFTSGSAPQTTDMMGGDGLEMFTTSCVTADASVDGGDRVGMFTTSC